MTVIAAFYNKSLRRSEDKKNLNVFLSTGSVYILW